MKFIIATLLEFVENTALVLPFVAATWFWAQHSRGKSILCMMSGALVGSLTIRLLEPLVIGEVETIGVTLVNIASIALLELIIIPYLGANASWSNTKTDWLIGGLAGGGLALAQSLAEAEPLGIGDIVHIIALGAGSALVLTSVRSLKGKSLRHALEWSLLIVLVMTLAISLLDYTWVLFQ